MRERSRPSSRTCRSWPTCSRARSESGADESVARTVLRSSPTCTSNSAASREHEAFVRDLQLLDRDAALAGIEGRPRPPDREPAPEAPLLHDLVAVVPELDHAVAARAVPVHECVVPAPEVVGD